MAGVVELQGFSKGGTIRFNLKSEADQAFEYLTQLSGKEALVDIKRVQAGRTLSQNSFFYLLISYFGLQIGYTPDEMKTYVKRHMSDVFLYEKKGEKFLRSTADLDKSEMTKVLDRLYRLAADMGVSLPLVDNAETRSLMLNEIERNKF